MNPKVTIIVLNWNGKEDTIECLESLKHITYPNYEILLVDNGSTDGSVECFRERYPGMEIIENGENLGFAEGNNVGIRRAMDEGADYVLLLNNDTVVDPEFLGELVKVAKSGMSIGIVGPKIYYYDYAGRNDVIYFAGAELVLWKGSDIKYGYREIDQGQCDEIKGVDEIEGTCLLIKSELVNKIGLLDPNFFAYREDTDFCMRAARKGFKLFYVPKAIIWHKVGASFGLARDNPFKVYLMIRNKFYVTKKNAENIDIYKFLIYFWLYDFWFHSAVYLIYHKSKKNFYSFLSGVKDGMKFILLSKDG